MFIIENISNSLPLPTAVEMPVLGFWQTVYLLWGAISPGLLAIIQQPKWSNIQRLGATVGFQLLASLVMVGCAGHFDLAHLGSSFSQVLMYTLLFYFGAWKSTLAPAIEMSSTKAMFGIKSLPCEELVNKLSEPVEGGKQSDEEVRDEALSEACSIPLTTKKEEATD